MATVLLFTDPLGRVCVAVWEAAICGENCAWGAKHLGHHIWLLTSYLSFIAFMLVSLYQSFFPCHRMVYVIWEETGTVRVGECSFYVGP